MIKIAHVEDNTADHIILKKFLDAHYDVQHFHELSDLFTAQDTFHLIISDLRLRDTYSQTK